MWPLNLVLHNWKFHKKGTLRRVTLFKSTLLGHIWQGQEQKRDRSKSGNKNVRIENKIIPTYRVGEIHMTVGEMRWTPAVDGLPSVVFGGHHNGEHWEQKDGVATVEAVNETVSAARLGVATRVGYQRNQFVHFGRCAVRSCYCLTAIWNSWIILIVWSSPIV